MVHQGCTANVTTQVQVPRKWNI